MGAPRAVDRMHTLRQCPLRRGKGAVLTRPAYTFAQFAGGWGECKGYLRSRVTGGNVPVHHFHGRPPAGSQRVGRGGGGHLNHPRLPQVRELRRHHPPHQQLCTALAAHRHRGNAGTEKNGVRGHWGARA
jgi:hypothetical protein